MALRLVYYDESGDDGYPNYSSPLFALSALYLHYLRWPQTYDAIKEFRRQVKARYGIPIATEIHTRNLVLGKKPFNVMGLPDMARLDLVGEMCHLIGQLEVRVINVVIVKPRIKHAGYGVLDKALTYSIQRIENDLDPRQNPDAKFLIITDDGRIGKMRKTARRIQRFNPISSIVQPGTTYRREISALVEDPLPKDSSQSYFIQLADLISYVVYHYATFETGVGRVHNRARNLLTESITQNWMDRLGRSLNTAAAPDPYGVKFHPT